MDVLTSRSFCAGKFPGWETLLYQATLPGLDEELAFRGVECGCLLCCFGQTSGRIWAAALTSLLFGFAHGSPLITARSTSQCCPLPTR
ncbi:CPBP family intramembrane metalloprotease [Acidipila sp. EB88]|nr:CPBP family intramembrane metalloprotease [Acidipila sp. EB88]